MASVVALAAPAAAEPVVLGDSLGVGVSMASGLKRLARNSVSIRGSGAVDQINQVPPGSIAFLSLGTNDAVGRIDGLERQIDNIVQAAARRSVKLVWLGPPCVRKSWDAQSSKLDQVLQARLTNTAVRYVSMRDEPLCAPAVHARDGVHFTMQGYSYMWAKARDAAGLKNPCDADAAECKAVEMLAKAPAKAAPGKIRHRRATRRPPRPIVRANSGFL